MIKKLVHILCVVSFFTSPAFTDDAAILTHIKTILWPKAYKTQDTKLLEHILDDSFQMIDNEGNRSSKANELEYLRTTVWNPGDFRYEIQRLDIYEGKWAVIDGKGIASSYEYMSSNYFIKVNGEWKAIASHVSGVKAVNDD